MNARCIPSTRRRGTRVINLTPTVYIERSGAREVDDKNYYGLAPNKAVRLLFGYNITCTEVKKDADGKVVSLVATHDPGVDGHQAAEGHPPLGEH